MSITPVIRTFTGRDVNPLALRPEDVDPIDIAHALSLCNRFAGHTIRPLSVAQHSIYAAELVKGDRETKLRALLHDAAEAYLGDMTKWLKRDPRMAAFREAEQIAQDAVYTRFGLPPGPMGPEVKRVDVLLVVYEGRQGLGADWKPAGGQETGYVEPTEDEIKTIDSLFGRWSYWHWTSAKTVYLDTLETLTRGGAA